MIEYERPEAFGSSFFLSETLRVLIVLHLRGLDEQYLPALIFKTREHVSIINLESMRNQSFLEGGKKIWRFKRTKSGNREAITHQIK